MGRVWTLRGGGGRVLDIGERRVGHQREGLDIREGRGIPVPWNVFEAPTRYV